MRLFRRKSKLEKLEKEYREKLEESRKMASINRAESDRLIYQAEQILIAIENEVE